MDAIIKAKEEKLYPHLVLLDMMMPKVNGYEIVQFLNYEGLIDRFPVVILSGHLDALMKQKCCDLGGRGYFIKPISLADYQDLLNELLLIIGL